MDPQNLKKWKSIRILMETAAGITTVVCIVIMVFFRTHLFTGAWKSIMNILLPFLYGAVIAYLLHPVCVWIEQILTGIYRKLSKGKNPKKRAFRLPALLLSIILMFAVLILLLVLVIPQLISSISGLLSQLPDALQRFQDWILKLDQGGESHEVVMYIQEAVNTLADRLQNFLKTDLLPNMQDLVGNITSSFLNIIDFLKNFGLGCIICAYFLGAWEKFGFQAKIVVYAILPVKAADWFKEQVRYTDRMFSGFVHGKLLDSLVIGLICFAFCAVTNMPYALLCSIIVGVTNIIPFFGPYIGLVPAALMILTVSPGKCVVFLIFDFLLQQVDGNLIGPKILGDNLGISSFWILFSILVAGGYWGLPGMIIGAPLFAVIYNLIREFLVKKLQLRGKEELVAAYRQEFPKEIQKKEKQKKKRKK